MRGLFILFFGSTDDCIFDVFRLLPIVVNIADSSLSNTIESYASGHFDNWILSIDMEQADAQETAILRHHCWLKTVPTTSFDRAGLCLREGKSGSRG